MLTCKKIILNRFDARALSLSLSIWRDKRKHERSNGFGGFRMISINLKFILSLSLSVSVVNFKTKIVFLGLVAGDLSFKCHTNYMNLYNLAVASFRPMRMYAPCYTIHWNEHHNENVRIQIASEQIEKACGIKLKLTREKKKLIAWWFAIYGTRLDVPSIWSSPCLKRPHANEIKCQLALAAPMAIQIIIKLNKIWAIFESIT